VVPVSGFAQPCAPRCGLRRFRLGDAGLWVGQFAGPDVPLLSRISRRLLAARAILDFILLSRRDDRGAGAGGGRDGSKAPRSSIDVPDGLIARPGSGGLRDSVRLASSPYPAVWFHALSRQIPGLGDLLAPAAGRACRFLASGFNASRWLCPG